MFIFINLGEEVTVNAQHIVDVIQITVEAGQPPMIGIRMVNGDQLQTPGTVQAFLGMLQTVMAGVGNKLVIPHLNGGRIQ